MYFFTSLLSFLFVFSGLAGLLSIIYPLKFLKIRTRQVGMLVFLFSLFCLIFSTSMMPTRISSVKRAEPATTNYSPYINEKMYAGSNNTKLFKTADMKENLAELKKDDEVHLLKLDKENNNIGYFEYIGKEQAVSGYAYIKEFRNMTSDREKELISESKREDIYFNNNVATKLFVKKPKANIRKAPVNGKIIHTARMNDILKRKKVQGNWFLVDFIGSGGKVGEGWIYSKLVENRYQRSHRVTLEEEAKETPAQKVAKNKGKYDKFQLVMTCQEGIRRQAKFPDKVDFPFFGGYTVLEKGWGYIINGKAEMMNGLGLMIPTRYKCTFDLREGKFTEARIL